MKLLETLGSGCMGVQRRLQVKSEMRTFTQKKPHLCLEFHTCHYFLTHSIPSQRTINFRRSWTTYIYMLKQSEKILQ